MPTYRPRKLSNEEIVALYKSGMDADSVGFVAGCCNTTVLTLVRAAGETVRKAAEVNTGKRKKLKMTEAEIVARYLAGDSSKKISYENNCSTGVVLRALERAGVPRRDSRTCRRNRAGTSAASEFNRYRTVGKKS